MSQTFTQAARTILGPLTSAWTAPESCSVAIAACSDCDHAFVAQTCGGGPDVHDNPVCWPPRNDSRIETPSTLNAWGFYSPGLHCPHGYISACSATAGGSSDWIVAFTLTGDETAIGCCPDGYSCVPGHKGSQTCQQIATTTTSFATATCEDGQTGQFKYITVPNSATTTYSRLAPMFEIVHQPSDLPSDHSSRPSSYSTKTVWPTSTPGESHSSSEKSGLSTGAKAGVGVGVGVGVLALLLLGFFIFRRRGNKGREKADGLPHEMAGKPVQRPAELSS